MTATPLAAPNLVLWWKKIRWLDRDQLLKIPGMESRRSDMILAGALLLQECMLALHADRVGQTEYSLRDGILDEQIAHLRTTPRVFDQDPLQDLFKTALELGSKKAELDQSLKISEAIFDRLRPVHKMGPEWKLYLQSASLLHNTGRTISPIDAEAHSAYVARFSDTPYFELWESRLLEELVFYAGNGKIEKSLMPFKKDRRLQIHFLKLLALLRLTAALSFQRSRPIKIERVRVDGRRVRLQISKRYFPELSLMRAEQRKQLFEEFFKRELVIEKV